MMNKMVNKKFYVVYYTDENGRGVELASGIYKNGKKALKETLKQIKSTIKYKEIEF